MSKIDLRPLLEYIPPAACSYKEWIDVGMALCHEGYSVDVWDEWSRKDPERYHDGECHKKWQSFKGNPNPVTGATLTQMAKDYGWQPHTKEDGNKVMDWDDTVTDNVVIVDQHYVQESEIKEPAQWNPADEIIRYLEALFDRSDKVGIVMSSFRRDDGKYSPSGSGTYSLTAGEYISRIKKYQRNGYSIKDIIGYALSDYDEKAGAWIRFNPLDGKGIKNENVSNYKYALVESDTLPPGKQKSIIEELELPVAALVYSGNKSIHAIVHIDAASQEEYRRRVDYLYKVCRKNGLPVDGADRNPSRLSRLPGIMRNGKKQFLMATHIGKEDFDSWKEWLETVNDDLPDPEDLSDVWNNMPDLSPSLIDGVLRQGHKMLISGPSKAGKSFALIELCIAIAEGTQWCGFQCTQGRILYVNLELDRASCLHRFKDVYTALNLRPDYISNIDIWNLRGKSLPMDQLAPKLIRRAQKKNYIAIVIDPIYKIITGDENSADQMARFCNQFDKVCTELSAAVIYCHHHSKGGQGMKRSMDRASGSGVFARDPDAILDMIQLCVNNDSRRTDYDREADKAAGITVKPTAWRIAGTLREFPMFEPVNMWFTYPIHRLDETGVLAMAAEEGSLEDIRTKGREAGNKAKTKQKEDRIAQIDTAYENLSMGGKHIVTIQDMASYLDVSEQSVRNYIKANGNYEYGEGKIYPKKTF